MTKLSLHFQVKDARWKASLPGWRSQARKAVKLVLKDAGITAESDISIVLADDAFVRDYNRDYRGKDKPTNILSFPSDEEGYLGDLLLAFETISSEAQTQHKTIAHHILHLLVHGTLHLLGHDHEVETEAETMENKEIAILAQLGIENPYE